MPRSERVRQSMRGVPAVEGFGCYVPTEAAVEKAVNWQRRGARRSAISAPTARPTM